MIPSRQKQFSVRLAVSLPGFERLHPLPVALIQPEGTVKQPDGGAQSGLQIGVMGKAVKQDLSVANGTGLDAFCQPGTNLSGASTLFLIKFGAKFTFHILHPVFEVSGLAHGLKLFSFPGHENTGQRKGLPGVRPI